MSETEEIARFFGEVQRIISKHGVNKVIDQLRMIGDYDEGAERDIGEYILVITANHFRVSKKDILYSKKRGLISESRRMCFALMKEHLPISDEKIGGIFGGRSRQYVNKELSDLPLNQDNFATKDEANFVHDFIELTTTVLYFKNEYELNNKNKPTG